MKTEYWALIVSIVALFASIGIPLWQWRESTARAIASKRTLLLQTILSTRSVNYVSMHELIWLLNKYEQQMEDEQRENLRALVPRMREHHDELEALHAEYSNYGDGATLSDIEITQAHADLAYTETQDTARLIENGRRSYEGT